MTDRKYGDTEIAIPATPDNMRIWDQVEQTDPAHTKAVQFGSRKFTAIDAMYQIKRATEEFGPVGQGWGYDCEYRVACCGKHHVVMCFVTVWHGSRGNSFGPVTGMNVITSGERLDEDAPKKAMTDALTKALSHLGFSADVFLGLYDDNRYVQDIGRKIKVAKHEATINAMRQAIKDDAPHAALEAWDELDENEKRTVWSEFSNHQKGELRKLFETARENNGVPPGDATLNQLEQENK